MDLAKKSYHLVKKSINRNPIRGSSVEISESRYSKFSLGSFFVLSRNGECWAAGYGLSILLCLSHFKRFRIKKIIEIVQNHWVKNRRSLKEHRGGPLPIAKNLLNLPNVTKLFQTKESPITIIPSYMIHNQRHFHRNILSGTKKTLCPLKEPAKGVSDCSIRIAEL